MEFNIEIVGLIATLFVLVSFLTSGEKNIRVINIIGAFIFVIYGLILGALSVWLLNGILFFVHIYKLYKLRPNPKYNYDKKDEKWKSMFINNKEVQIKNK